MKVRKVEVKTFNIEPLCEKCGEVLEDDSHGTIVATYPPKKQFKCPKCGNRHTLSKQYWPQTVAEEIGEPSIVELE